MDLGLLYILKEKNGQTPDKAHTSLASLTARSQTENSYSIIIFLCKTCNIKCMAFSISYGIRV